MSKTIAIVEDDPDIVEVISYHLEKEKFKVENFYNGESFLDYIKEHKPNLIILDLMLPGVDGLEICKILKSDPKTQLIPIIVVTAKGAESDRILGLELGADDYLTKPFSPKELVARIKAVLRRVEQKSVEEKIFSKAGLKVDFLHYEVFVDGKRIKLTKTEFEILKILITRPGWVFSRKQFIDEVWDYDKIISTRTVDVHIWNLRKKLGKYGKWIKSVSGIGYKFDAP
ncbi:MAG: response regulator [candidate division WOR-3 bacterium]|nr:response regulator [candidate division WOR-3 bacterium]MCX7757167.1 response regulator [candidate division WOR-3 bacterium]